MIAGRELVWLLLAIVALAAIVAVLALWLPLTLGSAA